jgi:hypothetical protein
MDDKDREWMYAIACSDETPMGDGTAAASAASSQAPQLSHTADARAAAAARARALLLGVAEADVMADFGGSAAIALGMSATGPSTGCSVGHLLPVDATNRAFLLAAELLRARRAAKDSALILAGSGASQSLEALGNRLEATLSEYPDDISAVAAAIRLIVAN